MSILENCDKEKVASIFRRLANIWKSKSTSPPVSIELCESLVISTLLYRADMATTCHTDGKKLEAAHHKFQQRLLEITRKDTEKNKEIRKRLGCES